jgi:DNA-binding NarL/FixJ family response regulator
MTPGLTDACSRTAPEVSGIKVLIVEDEPAIRRRLCEAVDAAPALVLCGSAGTVADACALVDRTAPDVVLADLGLPDGPGADVIRYAKASDPARDVVVVTLFGDDEHLIESIRAGATGYLLKDALPCDIAAAIVQVREGGSTMSPSIARRVLQSFNVGLQESPATGGAKRGGILSEREAEILRLVAKGFSFKEVGATLDISSSTVVTHIKRTYQKLEVHSRGEAVYEASQLGLL